MAWQIERLKESNGFVAKRIVGWILTYHCFLFGECFYIDHGKFGQIIHPSEVCIHHNSENMIYGVLSG